MNTVFALYTRPIDAGRGAHIVLAKDGVIVHQRLAGDGCTYTGDGNPGLVGKPITAMRGSGFRKVQPPRSAIGRAEFELGLAQDYRHYVG